MPSRHTSSTMSPVPHLSTIINLEPEEEPWCAGFAPSQGRRCHARTNAHGRSRAMKLLDKGTENLRAGRRIDDLLGELAPHVLCQRFHQNQAQTLTNRWSRQVSPFVKAPPSSPMRTITLDPNAARRQIPKETPTGRQRNLFDDMDRLRSESSSVDNGRHISTRSRDSEAIRDARRGVRISRPMNNDLEVITPTDHGALLIHAFRRPIPMTGSAAAEQHTVPVSFPRARYATTSSRNLSLSSRTSSPTQRENNNSTVLPLRSTTQTTSTSGATRRPIQGDCGICLSSMENVIFEDSDDEDSDEAEDGDSDESEDDENEWEDDEDEEHHSNSAGSHRVKSSSSNGEAADSHEESSNISSIERHDLVWCKAKCGVNYHKDCIDDWLASGHYSARTCPTCRLSWKC